MKKIKKSVWLPAIISIYFIIMAAIYGPELIRNHETMKFILVAGFEIIVIVGLIVFQRKRDKLK